MFVSKNIHIYGLITFIRKASRELNTTVDSNFKQTPKYVKKTKDEACRLLTFFAISHQSDDGQTYGYHIRNHPVPGHFVCKLLPFFFSGIAVLVGRTGFNFTFTFCVTQCIFESSFQTLRNFWGSFMLYRLLRILMRLVHKVLCRVLF